MASAEEQDAQFTAGDVERRVAELERKLSLLNEAGLDRLTQSGYLQFDGLPVRIDKYGIQIEAPTQGVQYGALYWVPAFSTNPSSEEPRAEIYGNASALLPSVVVQAQQQNNYYGSFVGQVLDSGGGNVVADAYLQSAASASYFGSAIMRSSLSAQDVWFELQRAHFRFHLHGADPTSLTDGAMWYRSDTDKFRGRANGATDNFAMEGWVTTEIAAAGGSSMPMPPIVGTQSWNCLGVEMAAQTVAAPASATWPANNRIVGIPVKVTEDCTVTKLWVMNGATANANINMCLYDSSFAQIANSEMGSTAQAGTDVIQEFDITNVAITAGLYYIACVFSATTGTAYRVVAGGVAPIEVGQSWGIWQQDLANVDLPSTATPAVAAASFTPIMGMSVSPRTLVT